MFFNVARGEKMKRRKQESDTCTLIDGSILAKFRLRFGTGTNGGEVGLETCVAVNERDLNRL